jgi:hypothetical protein
VILRSLSIQMVTMTMTRVFRWQMNCVVAPLVRELQYNNIPIILFSIDQDTLTEKYDSYQDWYSVNRLRSCKIPTKENFMGTTFWCVYFDSFNECFYEPWSRL